MKKNTKEIFEITRTLQPGINDVQKDEYSMLMG